MNPFLFFYLLLFPWTLYSPFPGFPVRIIWADFFFLPMICQSCFKHWKAKKSVSIFPFDKAAFLLIGVLFLTVLLTAPSLRSALKYFGMLYGVSILIVLRMAVRREADLTKVFYVWFWLALALSATGIAAYVAAQWQKAPNFFVVKDHAYLGDGRFLWRLWSVGYTPSMLASYLHVGLLSLLWLKIGEQRKAGGLLWLIALLAILLAIFLTQSRALLGALVSLGVLWAVHFKTLTLPKKISVVLFFFFLGALAVGVGASLWYQTPVFSGDPSIYRFYNLLSFALFREHPFVGVGIGEFQNYAAAPHEILRRYYPDFLKVLPEKWWGAFHDPHSTYQGRLAEAGLIGVTAIFMFLARMLCSLIRRVKQSPSGFQRDRSAVLLAGVIGFCANGFYMDILSLRYFWFWCACVGAFYDVNRRIEP